MKFYFGVFLIGAASALPFAAVASFSVFDKQPHSLLALEQAALERTRKPVRYDGRYLKIPYPGGDVPDSMGVCTDVIIRSYRALGIDLQELVHKDMEQNFKLYPSKRIWGLSSPDSNIDHRRVPNLQVFFQRFGKRLSISKRGQDYKPGDIVTWKIAGKMPHIGIVVSQKSADGLRPLIVHNAGWGTVMEDFLFAFPIDGHYRFEGS